MGAGIGFNTASKKRYSRFGVHESYCWFWISYLIWMRAMYE